MTNSNSNQYTIRRIKLPMPLMMGHVNCYLIETESGFTLVDTGGANSRAVLRGELERSGCKPGLLRLIVLTHGDADHSGNAATLRRELGGRIAMHAGDLRMVKEGDVFAGRQNPDLALQLLLRSSVLINSERFSPDVLVQEGDTLAVYGLEARIVETPGHTSGSISMLTGEGELFCGDLLVNRSKPAFNRLIDDWEAARASLEKLRGMQVGWVYPGHGRPFEMEQCEV